MLCRTLLWALIMLFSTLSYAFDVQQGIARTVKIYRADVVGLPTFSGSGVYMSKGTVLTAGHVCASGIHSIEFAFEGELYNGPVAMKFSPDNPDFCILKTKMRRKVRLRALKLGKPLSVNTRKPIFIMGYPGNWFTLERGFVVGERYRDRYDKLYMLDRGAMPGISGGPAFYEDGTLAGLVVAMVIWKNGRDNGSALVEGVQAIKKWMDKQGIKYE